MSTRPSFQPGRPRREKISAGAHVRRIETERHATSHWLATIDNSPTRRIIGRSPCAQTSAERRRPKRAGSRKPLKNKRVRRSARLSAHASSPGGTRTPDQGIMSQRASPVNVEEYSNPDESAAAGAAVEPEEVPIDPDLQLVIDAWETLPETTKVGILAMVRAAGNRVD